MLRVFTPLSVSLSLLPSSHSHRSFVFFFFNDTATTEIYTLSLHDALPISWAPRSNISATRSSTTPLLLRLIRWPRWTRSEEHTSELQSRLHLVCRLLLEKKKPTVAYIRRLTFLTFLLISVSPDSTL